MLKVGDKVNIKLSSFYSWLEEYYQGETTITIIDTDEGLVCVDWDDNSWQVLPLKELELCEQSVHGIQKEK